MNSVTLPVKKNQKNKRTGVRLLIIRELPENLF